MATDQRTKEWQVTEDDVASIDAANEAAGADRYGNPLDGSRLIYCCFPDCGCDGARLCSAENGASSGAIELNLERRRR